MRSQCWPSWWRWDPHLPGFEGLLLKIQRPGILAGQEGLGGPPLLLCFSVICTAPGGESKASQGLSLRRCLPSLPRLRERTGGHHQLPTHPSQTPSLLFQDGSKNEGFQPLVEALSDISRPSESG